MSPQERSEIVSGQVRADIVHLLKAKCAIDPELTADSVMRIVAKYLLSEVGK